MRRLRQLLVDHDGPALVGVDFSLGYPLGPDGKPLLPTGRRLAAHLSTVIEDAPDGKNNRFLVAAELNRRLSQRLGGAPGPFWACPARVANEDLTANKCDSPMPEWRAVERALQARGRRPQSSWKLYTAGSVGGQTLLGLAALGRCLEAPELGPRLQLWPFDGGFAKPSAPRAIVVAEIWPSLATLPVRPNAIKDALQVTAMRDAALAQSDPWAPLVRPPGLDGAGIARARQEGWILGLPDIIPAVPPA